MSENYPAPDLASPVAAPPANDRQHSAKEPAGLSMNRALLASALRRIIRRKGRRPGPGTQALIDYFDGAAMVVPAPKYGNIVYDVEADYCFPAIKSLMDRRRERIASRFRNQLSPFYHHRLLDTISTEKLNEHDYHWKNGYFSEGDGRALYAMLAHCRPYRMIEMGVGNSTKMARKAIRDFGLPTEIVSIDPSPRANINGITDRHVRGSITSVATDLFAGLEPGDFLFIDGSHISHCGTDVPHYALNILPVLKPGVYVHVHDITLPWEYSNEFRIRHYNEQYVVGAMLTCEASWEIVLPVTYAFREGILPHKGGSLWLKKK